MSVEDVIEKALSDWASEPYGRSRAKAIADALREAGMVDDDFVKHNALIKARTALIVCVSPEYPLRERIETADEMIKEIEEVTRVKPKP